MRRASTGGDRVTLHYTYVMIILIVVRNGLVDLNKYIYSSAVLIHIEDIIESRFVWEMSTSVEHPDTEHLSPHSTSLAYVLSTNHYFFICCHVVISLMVHESFPIGC